MKNLIYKELKLTISPVLYLFTALTLFMFIPSFPPISNMAYSLIGLITILNVAIGERDFEFTALLPVPRRYIVASKCFDLIYSQFIQLLTSIPCSILLVCVIAPNGNALGQNTNIFFFGMVFINYAIFNLIFLPWFFKTAEKVNKPLLTGLGAFLVMSILYTVIIKIFPILNGISATGAKLRVIILIIAIAIYLGITYLAYRLALNNFKKVSL
ncbi:ABC-2 transporter permease [Clostridiaceae bacterium M8S5]|nr:ABC-2 transporter permease [Clostridiaceae bacterium M8S5]